jgi:queuine/archaeosine tRNA-ribosyltransferase
MDKGQRKRMTFLKYKKRIARWTQMVCQYQTRDGETIYFPKTVDVMNDGACLDFKSMATRCSCYCCSGYYKYRRNEFKQETERLLKEYRED